MFTFGSSRHYDVFPLGFSQQVLVYLKQNHHVEDKSNIKHIAIAGNIGAGKTTLTSLLAKSFKWQPHYEDVENNPYLNDFYSDMPRWSFALQVYFLHTRFKQIIKIQQ